ncbi:MAG TPA: lactate utilization protein [Chthoniobacterales bacterium]
MNSREAILGRIQEALRVPAAPPSEHNHGHDGGSGRHGPLSGTQGMQAWLPLVPSGADGQLALFQKNCTMLRTELHVVSGQEEARQTLAAVRDAHHWTRAAVHRNELLDAVVPSLQLEMLYTEQRPDAAALETCSVGITACDALVAQTGSILLTARSAGGRSLSVLPPHHVVVARGDQLVPDLPAAFDLLKSRYGFRYPSFTTLITGPSRTGDIERILVLGAHGPKNLTIVLMR